MNRRELVRAATAGGLVGLAGCARVRCAMDGDYDELELATVPADVVRTSASVVVEYGDLAASEQRAVRKAAASGSYRQCHQFDDARTGIEALGDRIGRRCERVASDPPCGERTYVEYDGNYYALDLTVLDVRVADSIDEE